MLAHRFDQETLGPDRHSPDRQQAEHGTFRCAGAPRQSFRVAFEFRDTEAPPDLGEDQHAAKKTDGCQ